MSLPERLVPSRALIRRIEDAECGYTWSRIKVLERLPGNPVGVAAARFGDAWAFRARYLPIPSFNRVVTLADGQAGDVPAIDAWFAEGGASGRFELAPDEPMDRLAPALTQAGYVHTGFHATLYGDPAVPSLAGAAVDVEKVTTANFDDFIAAYAKGWNVSDPEGLKRNVRGWLDQPDWTLYLGRRNGRPAGAAILYLVDRVGYLADSSVDPDHRGHGVHRALIDRRRADATMAGADLVCVQAAFLSTSYRNMVRAHFLPLFTQAYWTKAA